MMELEWDTRPLRSTEFAGPSSAFLSRRRSTAAHVPPPGPPPTQPVPHLPPVPFIEQQQYDPYDNADFDPPAQPYPYARPAASANLAAVTAYSQAQARQTNPSPPSSPSPSNLSDSPPQSRLRSPPPRPAVHTHDIMPDRLLLSPPQPRPAEARPSSRRALTKALELAREAVQIDSTNDDPYAAVAAYGKSVALLSEVMQRVMRGEDSTESSRRQNGRRRSVVAQEEEVRRLKAIHDTYAQRMNILSLIYSIPLPHHSPPSTYASSSSVSASSNSTQASSPTSTSPSSDSSGHARSRTSSSSSSHAYHPPDESRSSAETTRGLMADESDGALAIGAAMFTLDTSTSSGGLSPLTPVAPSVHPYASASAPLHARQSVISPTRPLNLRPRASSTLPPPAPPPTTSPPPAPAIVEPPPDASSARLRPRGQSVSHTRTGSGSRLAALQEESERNNDRPSFPAARTNDEELARPPSRNVPQFSHESHPLPPLPSPASVESATTPRNAVAASDSVPNTPQSPANVPMPRPRGAPTLSLRSDLAPPTNHVPLINTSPVMGTISQRRVKTSAPPSSAGSVSPTESAVSTASVPGMSRLTASSLPASTASSLGMGGRSRAASQPGRRPSLATANSYPFPPLTAGAGNPNGARKTSVPSKLNPNATPQITINTAMLSPPLTSATLPIVLVPPPPIPQGIPTAPTSPLPPMAPPDPLRKPYHMMTLLRQTMTSRSGGYVTRRLHVPQEVWSQGGAKLTNVPEKIRVVEVLCSALEEVHNWSVEYFGAGNVSSGMVLGIGSIGKKEGEAWAAKLEDFSSVCDGVVGNFGKKLGVGEGFVTKKSSGVTSWGGKLTRQFDRITNGKNLDSPAIYVQGLSKLFMQAQILDEHTKALSAQSLAPLYASFPVDLRAALEVKLRHASEFFAKVVLTFVIRDMALLLDKYVKKCEKWLAE